MDKYTKTDYSDIIIKNGEIVPTTNVVSELNQLNKERDTLEAENKALRGYTKHNLYCMWWIKISDEMRSNCNCGLSNLLSKDRTK